MSSAEVIKIEHPTQGDDTRSWGPPFSEYTKDISCAANPNNKLKAHSQKGESAYFLCVNRNKKSVTINIKEKQGQELIKELAKSCDVFIENYIPGKLSEMGLGYEDIRKVNDRIIYTSITGYGQTGPYAKHPGYDVMIEAEAGLMYITGEKHGPPVKVGVAITALLSRHKTNKGQHLDISLLGAQVSALANIASNYLIGGKEASRWGAEHASIVPYRTYETKTLPICIGGGNDNQFKSIAKSLGLAKLIEDPKYKTNADRVKNRDELDKIIQDKLLEMTRDEILEKMSNKGFPITPVNNIQQTFEHPQVTHMGLVREIEHPGLGKIKVVGPPVQYSDTKATVYSPPPMLGQHTYEVLNDILGLPDERIQELCKNGTISTFDYGL
ncbi:Succinate-hydroxymethylglutarate CoA-transferase [Zancudomyces culisetae]|uniref:Succinate-hydroxymethylglutarate CoA-transferase n=1 Tax=Zancudomyces culisetae TaxID=1213189 RepID=A0A1R1PII3_ZANCU|nr:Succinate-hydroxymethylglutarate CoA-transferase [Zancudomyces culisetae]|eukprot:OMH80791.1 Succinate-hydroxymethylglutarate CoA-transferase [Zancudomyces culisetae]